jgi:hypothetical protein
MTSSDPVARRPSLWVVAGIIIGTAFLAGAVSGYVDATLEKGGSAPSAAMLFGLVSVLGLAALGLYLSRFGRFWKHWSRRKQLYVVSISLSAFLGFVISIGLRQASGSQSGFDPFGNGPVALVPALIVAAVWLLGMALAIGLYQRNIDEHEQRAYLWGGVAGFNAIAMIAPVWWLLARAGQLPPVDGMLLFLMSAAANAAVYLWIKYR